jgi:hypothetical protein
MADYKAFSGEVSNGFSHRLPTDLVVPGQLLVGREAALELSAQQAATKVVDDLCPKR